MKELPGSPNEIEANIAEFTPLVVSMIQEARPFSFQEYLGYASLQALLALKEGNYGVGAVYVFRTQGKEYVVGGRNGIKSRRDSSLHAEFDAINALESFARGEPTYKDRLLLGSPRKIRHQREERVLVTSLEPCIMCTGRILTHGLDSVFIGAPETDGGAMLDGRELNLPPIWRDAIAGKVGLDGRSSPKPLKIITPDTSNPDSLDYIDPKFVDIPLKIVRSNSAKINKLMGRHKLVDLKSVPRNVELLTASGS